MSSSSSSSSSQSQSATARLGGGADGGADGGTTGGSSASGGGSSAGRSGGGGPRGPSGAAKSLPSGSGMSPSSLARQPGYFRHWLHHEHSPEDFRGPLLTEKRKDFVPRGAGDLFIYDEGPSPSSDDDWLSSSEEEENGEQDEVVFSSSSSSEDDGEDEEEVSPAGQDPLSVRAQLQFPVRQVRRNLRRRIRRGGFAPEEEKEGGELDGAVVVEGSAAVYLAAVLEYTVAEVLELAGNSCRFRMANVIFPIHIQASDIRTAIEADDELRKLCAESPTQETPVPVLQENHANPVEVVRVQANFGGAPGPGLIIPQAPAVLSPGALIAAATEGKFGKGTSSAVAVAAGPPTLGGGVSSPPSGSLAGAAVTTTPAKDPGDLPPGAGAGSPFKVSPARTVDAGPFGGGPAAAAAAAVQGASARSQPEFDDASNTREKALEETSPVFLGGGQQPKVGPAAASSSAEGSAVNSQSPLAGNPFQFSPKRSPQPHPSPVRTNTFAFPSSSGLEDSAKTPPASPGASLSPSGSPAKGYTSPMAGLGLQQGIAAQPGGGAAPKVNQLYCGPPQLGRQREGPRPGGLQLGRGQLGQPQLGQQQQQPGPGRGLQLGGGQFGQPQLGQQQQQPGPGRGLQLGGGQFGQPQLGQQQQQPGPGRGVQLGWLRNVVGQGPSQGPQPPPPMQLGAGRGGFLQQPATGVVNQVNPFVQQQPPPPAPFQHAGMWDRSFSVPVNDLPGNTGRTAYFHHAAVNANESQEEDRYRCWQEKHEIAVLAGGTGSVAALAPPSEFGGNGFGILSRTALGKDLFKLFDSKDKFADVKITAGGLGRDDANDSGGRERTFFAHRNILSARCETFDRMFSGSFREGAKLEEGDMHHVKFPEVSADAMSRLLEFLYSGSCAVNAETATEMLAISDEFLVPTLKNLCEEFLAAAVDPDSAMDLLQLAERFGARHLARKCADVLLSNAESLDTEKLADLEPELVRVLLTEAMKRLSSTGQQQQRSHARFGFFGGPFGQHPGGAQIVNQPFQMPPGVLPPGGDVAGGQLTPPFP